jgi:hypothetical protein
VLISGKVLVAASSRCTSGNQDCFASAPQSIHPSAPPADRRQNSPVQHLIVKSANLDFRPKGFLCPVARFADLSWQPEFRKAGELLLRRQLHVMAGNAFMVRDGFVVDQRPFCKIGIGDNHASGAFTGRISNPLRHILSFAVGSSTNDRNPELGFFPPWSRLIDAARKPPYPFVVIF